MKLFLIFITFILITTSAFAQDSLTVALDDWNFIHQTTHELEIALDDCDTLLVMYENRMSLFQMEVSDLEQASLLCDSLVDGKDQQLGWRQEQIDLLNEKIQKQKLELMITRGGGIIAVVVAILLLK